MTIAVVDVFESVQIDGMQGNGFGLRVGMQTRCVERFAQDKPVRQARERIQSGQAGKMQFGDELPQHRSVRLCQDKLPLVIANC